MDIKAEEKKIIDLKKKLLKLKMDNGMATLTDFSQIKKTRKEIARALTQVSLAKKNGNK